MDLETELMFRSAEVAELRLAADGFGRDRLAELDWKKLTGKLSGHRLLPTLGPRIVELAGPSVDAAFASAVEGALTAARHQGAFLQLISQQVSERLAAEGIRSAPLKGPALSEVLYQDPGRRLSSDIDLLVPPDRLQDAALTAADLGYSPPDDYTTADGLPRLHLTLIHAAGTLPPLELHWRIHWYERRFATEKLLPPDLDGQGGWQPEPADQLAALLLYYARDGFLGLRLATDLGSWWDRFGREIGSDDLDAVARSYPELTRAISVSARAAERVVGLPSRRLISSTAGLRERVGVRLVNPQSTGNQAQLYADRGFIDGLLAPRGDFGGFVRRQLLPPREVLDQQARHGQRERARSSVARLFGVLGRYVLTAARLLDPRGSYQ